MQEAFCIAIIEAASCGLLVVSTRVGGVPEVLPSDILLLANPNPESLVDAIRDALVKVRDISPWDVHDRVAQMYSWDEVAMRTEAVYERVARSKVLARPWDSIHRPLHCQKAHFLLGRGAPSRGMFFRWFRSQISCYFQVFDKKNCDISAAPPATSLCGLRSSPTQLQPAHVPYTPSLVARMPPSNGHKSRSTVLVGVCGGGLGYLPLSDRWRVTDWNGKWGG